ncbi:hypothetical protein OCS_01076 [Ophiocordyceps sinensis CO18]|uniref:Uncharacterized protein n=1 Tax=Ophiocordyceps sinensis (strain Co18 / CGMCC 3.14243) TaxID=911162 RepID=T5AN07_OPHSC|nr:hypothetical protein OCS_01076 [Ophiocordyceps sinensis CO18]
MKASTILLAIAGLAAARPASDPSGPVHPDIIRHIWGDPKTKQVDDVSPNSRLEKIVQDYTPTPKYPGAPNPNDPPRTQEEIDGILDEFDLVDGVPLHEHNVSVSLHG